MGGPHVPCDGLLNKEPSSVYNSWIARAVPSRGGGGGFLFCGCPLGCGGGGGGGGGFLLNWVPSVPRVGGLNYCERGPVGSSSGGSRSCGSDREDLDKPE